MHLIPKIDGPLAIPNNTANIVVRAHLHCDHTANKPHIRPHADQQKRSHL